MTELKQRFVQHLKLGRGGFSFGYEILDGNKVVGHKAVGRESRKHPITATYTLGDREFSHARDFLAAYEATKAAAA